MSPARQWQLIALASFLLMALATAPYLAAYQVTDHAFAGALINPIDGVSYFAKMQAGARGDFLFVLPYTHNATGPGVLIYGFYLLLGHLAHWLGLSLDVVYHTARAIFSLFFLLSAYALLCDLIPAARGRLLAWGLFALGSGLGWAAVFAGAFTADLWVAEYIPFLSILTNPHFPLAAALQLWIFKWTLLPRPKVPLGRLAVVTLSLGFVQPLALVTAGLILGVFTLWQLRREKRRTGAWRWPVATPLLIVSVCALPWLIYTFAITLINPMIKAWTAQNNTPSPVWWEALISGGLPLALALIGGYWAARRRSEQDKLFLLWFGLSVVVLYVPFALQRRLSMGLWLPLVLLAWVGWRDVIQPRLPGRARLLVITLVALFATLSNGLVYLSMWAGIQKREPAVFLTLDEQAGLRWLAEHAGRGVVLASPKMGLFIPARSEARVLYGHPFETLNAEFYEMVAASFFDSRVSTLHGFLAGGYPVDFVFYGPREKALAPPGYAPDFGGWAACFAQREVAIYAQTCP
jgi:hypothetical protein